MYPHTIAGLFDAVAKGTLTDVEEIVNSKEVDVNQLHNGVHIINYLLKKQFQQYHNKIHCLINAGATLHFDKSDKGNLYFYIEIKNRNIT